MDALYVVDIWSSLRGISTYSVLGLRLYDTLRVSETITRRHVLPMPSSLLTFL